MFSPCVNYHLALTLSLPPSYTTIPQSFSFEIALLLHILYKSLLLLNLHYFILHVASIDGNLEGNEHVLEPIDDQCTNFLNV